MPEAAMGFVRQKHTPFKIALKTQGVVPPPAKIAAQFPADYFDTPQEVAGKAGRELTALRQARQMRDAWRRERYGRLRGE
jgi:hypothetical protein